MLLDDLEIVGEISIEHERGWEYDLDWRDVDLGSPLGALPERRVHALDDPLGVNPDAATRPPTATWPRRLTRRRWR